MRLSLWQQFSSNHSGGFTLVGMFKTTDEAQAAYETIEKMLVKTATYYRENSDWAYKAADEAAHNGDYIPMTDIENELADEYGLDEWWHSIDWALQAVDAYLGGRGLYRYENLVFLNSVGETWDYGEPFQEFLQKQGAQVEYMAADVDNSQPVVNMTCLALNVDSASTIVEKLSSIKTYKDGPSYPLIKLSDELIYLGAISGGDTVVSIREMPTWSWASKPYISLAEFLPKLVSYLKEKGCTNFEFSIASKVEE